MTYRTELGSAPPSVAAAATRTGPVTESRANVSEVRLRWWLGGIRVLRNVSPLKSSGHYMCHQYNIQQAYVLPTQCIYVFLWISEKNSDYFPIQH